MTIQAQTDTSGHHETPHIPDVNDLPLFQAALAYANAGLYVLPVKIGKHPGSVVGDGWPEQSTRDPDVIESYWDRPEQRGIALHTGKSNLIAFDLDVDALPDELGWLRGGLFQHTRRHGGARGHYVFASPEIFVSGGLVLSNGTSVGEIRSGNTVIIAEPSPHAKADDGGQYRWAAYGDLPSLPEIAHQYLTPYGTTRARWSGSIEASGELVIEALADWTGNTRPKALTGQVDWVRNARSGTRHRTLRACKIVASEARVGFYPLSSAVTAIGAAMMESYKKRGEPGKFDQHEFSRLVAGGVGYALSRSRKEILLEANRSYDGFDGFKPTSRFPFRPIFASLVKPAFYGTAS